MFRTEPLILSKRLRLPDMAKRTGKRRKKAAKKSAPPNFVAGLTLLSIRLVESSSTLHIVDNAVPQKMRVGLSMASAMRPDGKLAVLVNTEVDAEALKNKESHLKIHSKFECLYKTESEPSEDEARAACSIGVMAMWPYVREFTSNVSSRMGLTPLVLPLARTRNGEITIGET